MKKAQGSLLGYSGSIPGNPEPSKKKVSQEISNMINSLSELPSGKLPKAQYPIKQKT